MGELTISSDHGVSVRAGDGLTDSLLAKFLADRTRAATDSVKAEIDARVAQVGVLGTEHRTRCGYSLNVGSGTVSVAALPTGDQSGRGWPTYGQVRISFGRNLPGDTCSDVADENAAAFVDAQWPVSFERLEFAITPSTGACGDATLVVLGAYAIAKDGRLVALPDPLVTRNGGFGLFPPNECYLGN